MEKEISRQQLLITMFSIFLTGCIMGWVYEMGFYRINDGHFVKRGQGFGPWLPIYGVGALAITILLYRFKNNPVIVFIGSGAVAGVIEFAVGWSLFHFCNGLRLWDYNVEIWNWGNVGGYICFRSILIFSFAGLLCVYIIIPKIYELTQRTERMLLTATTVSLGVLLTIDIIVGYMIRPLTRILIQKF